MLKDVTLGQYFPGNSPVHEMDPRVKIVLTLFYIVLLFVANSVSAYVLLILYICSVVLIAKLTLKTILSGLKPLLILVALTAILNLLYTTGEHLLVSFWRIRIYAEGIKTACFMALRILLLVCGTLILTYTTAPIRLTDGLESLLKPLNRIHVPVHELAMMMSIALRFIPTLIEETDKIMSAQKARGAEFDTGNLLQKAKALVPLLVPLFVSAFRRADELATAMEARCYHGGEGRTRLHVLKLGKIDLFAILEGVLLLILIVLCRRFGI